MANCLKTQLKEVVNNRKLPYFGMLTFSVENAVGRYVSFSAISNNKCKILLDGVTVKVGETQFTDEYPIRVDSGGVTIVSTESSGMVKVTNKYDLTSISIVLCTPNFTTGDLKCCQNLNDLVFSKTGLKGELNDLVSLPLISLGIDGTNITGNVTDFLNTIATNRKDGDTLTLYVNPNCTNIPAGIGTSYATRGIVEFNGSGEWSVTTLNN